MRQLLGAAESSAAAARIVDIPIAGNPTGSIGLAAVNGASSAWMRSDSTQALSQAITPTWTGLHTFTAGLTVFGSAFTSRGITDNGGATALAISSAGNVSVNIPTSTTSSVGGYALNVKAPTTSGGSYGLLILAGTTSADQGLQVLNAAGSADLFSVAGDGSIALPSVATTTTAPATGTAGALPAKPKGYFSISIAGYAAKIPYY